MYIVPQIESDMEEDAYMSKHVAYKITAHDHERGVAWDVFPVTDVCGDLESHIRELLTKAGVTWEYVRVDELSTMDFASVEYHDSRGCNPREGFYNPSREVVMARYAEEYA